MKILMLLIMIFLHIVDDYYLQGVLARMKQKSFWRENAPDKLYKNDYKVALLTHGFSWTFMVMLPVTITMMVSNNYHTVLYIIIFIINMLLHATIDHLKANIHTINLIQDQTCHIAQIVAIWSIFFVSGILC